MGRTGGLEGQIEADRRRGYPEPKPHDRLAARPGRAADPNTDRNAARRVWSDYEREVRQRAEAAAEKARQERERRQQQRAQGGFRTRLREEWTRQRIEAAMPWDRLEERPKPLTETVTQRAARERAEAGPGETGAQAPGPAAHPDAAGGADIGGLCFPAAQ